MTKRGPKPKRKEVVWSPELAYAIGLIATDGNLSKDGRHIVIVSKDREQLENLTKCLGITARIKNHSPGAKGWACKNEIYYRLQWGDITLYKFLLEVGLTPNKSLTVGALNIPDIYFFDFLRGGYDGDGSFYSYQDARWKSSFMFYLTFISASRAHILWIRETLGRLCSVHGHTTINGSKCRMHNLRFAKKEASIVLGHMYTSESVISLSRKRLKIQRVLGIVGLTLPLVGGGM